MKILRFLNRVYFNLASVILLPILLITIVPLSIVTRLKRPSKPRLFFGPIPIISNKYWSRAMAQVGFYSKTVVVTVYTTINKLDDYDIILHKPILNKGLKLFSLFFNPAKSYFSFYYYLTKFDIFHIPCSGFLLGHTLSWRLEAPIMHFLNKKIIVLPYGGDFYQYSKIKSPSLLHGLLLSYPLPGRFERDKSRKVSYWTKHSDVFIPACQLDGIGRWDVLPFSWISIDLQEWQEKGSYSTADGKKSVVNIVHTPNHKGFKGTEFLSQAIQELKEEGHLINFILLEKVQNSEVRRVLFEEADILAEQFIATGYALSGIEGMATGLPVMANLDEEVYTRLFRRYSFLNECPILSTPVEKLKEHLRILVTQPQLREELGRAGRAYVEKYHSYQASQYMFGKIYENIWEGKDVDLMNLYHPLKKESYNNMSPIIKHPLVENKLPISS